MKTTGGAWPWIWGWVWVFDALSRNCDCCCVEVLECGFEGVVCVGFGSLLVMLVFPSIGCNILRFDGVRSAEPEESTSKRPRALPSFCGVGPREVRARLGERKGRG